MIITNYSKQHGLTLIELMVSLLISLLIMAGLFTVYQSNQRGYRLNDGLVRVQENGRFAIDFLSRDIRRSGFPFEIPAGAPPATMPVQYYLFDSGANDVDVIGTAAGNFPTSDILALRHGNFSNLTADCSGVTVTPGVAGGGNADPNQAETTLNIYDIRNTGRTNNRGNPVLALFCNGAEIVEGIENIQVLYGVDTDFPRDYIANQYVTFDNVPNYDIDPKPDWDRIVSLRIALLASSVDEKANAPSPRTFNLLNVTLGPYDGSGAMAADQKIRRIYTTTILIRNNAIIQI